VLHIYQHDRKITDLLALASRLATSSPPSPPLARVLRSHADAILDAIGKSTVGSARIVSYPTEADLLAYAQSVTDFFILDLANHFRRYDPKDRHPRNTVGTFDVLNRRNAGMAARRLSGHVTSSFAEAMCPWVMKRFGLMDGRIFRLASLAPSPFGRVLADFAFEQATTLVPCEVKHLVGSHRIDVVGRGLSQAAATMLHLPADTGFLFIALSDRNLAARYRIDVVKLAA
jgi:hypothetical protein